MLRSFLHPDTALGVLIGMAIMSAGFSVIDIIVHAVRGAHQNTAQ